MAYLLSPNRVGRRPRWPQFERRRETGHERPHAVAPQGGGVPAQRETEVIGHRVDDPLNRSGSVGSTTVGPQLEPWGLSDAAEADHATGQQDQRRPDGVEGAMKSKRRQETVRPVPQISQYQPQAEGDQ